jgi:hypothetical protein
MLTKEHTLETKLSPEECQARLNATPSLRGFARSDRFCFMRQRLIRNGLGPVARGRFVPTDVGTRIELVIGLPRGAPVFYGIALVFPVAWAVFAGAWWLLVLVPLGAVYLGATGALLSAIGAPDAEVLLATIRAAVTNGNEAPS